MKSSAQFKSANNTHGKFSGMPEADQGPVIIMVVLTRNRPDKKIQGVAAIMSQKGKVLGTYSAYISALTKSFREFDSSIEVPLDGYEFATSIDDMMTGLRSFLFACNDISEPVFAGFVEPGKADDMHQAGYFQLIYNERPSETWDNYLRLPDSDLNMFLDQMYGMGYAPTVIYNDNPSIGGEKTDLHVSPIPPMLEVESYNRIYWAARNRHPDLEPYRLF